MMFRKSVVLIALGTVASAAGPAPSDLLAQALDAHAHTTFAVQQRIRAYQPTGMVEYRVGIEQSADGKRRVVFHTPIRHKGTIIVDDGKEMMHFDPRANVCETRPSMPEFAVGDARRNALIRQNYLVTQSGNEKLGGRMTTILTAKPRHQGMLRRTYWVDNEHRVFLRMKVTSEKGETLYESEMLLPDFDRPIPASTFCTNLGCGVKEIKHEKPQVFTTISQLQKKTGFEVLNPDELPLGMVFVSAEAVPYEGRYTAVLRYSDGLARASVYQTPTAVKVFQLSANAGAERFAVSVNQGTRVMIVGDLGESGLAEFVRVFDKANKERQMRWSRELAQKLSVPSSAVEQLRDLGLGFDDVAFLIAVHNESQRKLSELQEWYRSGLSRVQIAQRSNVDWAKVKRLMREAGLGD